LKSFGKFLDDAPVKPVIGQPSCTFDTTSFSRTVSTVFGCGVAKLDERRIVGRLYGKFKMRYDLDRICEGTRRGLEIM